MLRFALNLLPDQNGVKMSKPGWVRYDSEANPTLDVGTAAGDADLCRQQPQTCGAAWADRIDVVLSFHHTPLSHTTKTRELTTHILPLAAGPVTALQGTSTGAVLRFQANPTIAIVPSPKRVAEIGSGTTAVPGDHNVIEPDVRIVCPNPDAPCRRNGEEG
jgi:hypothetical protein